jgi:hypothetical protein
MTACQDANRNGIEQEAAGLQIDAVTLWLRVAISKGGRCRFSYSLDEQKFIPLGGEFTGSKARWIGAKVGLFVVAAPGVGKTGYADFDWFHVEPPSVKSQAARP